MMLYFILGIVFYGFAIPIAESIVSLIVTFFEWLKGKLSVKMVKLQLEIDSAENKESTYAIGFDTDCYTSLSDEDEEEMEDE